MSVERTGAAHFDADASTYLSFPGTESSFCSPFPSECALTSATLCCFGAPTPNARTMNASASTPAHRPTFTAIPLILIFGSGFSFLTSNDDSRVNPSRLLSYCTFISSSFIPIPPLLSNFTRKSRKT